jgi:hypothetical protein
MGVFRKKRDFFKLRTQLAADTIPPIYIVFKMPPKTAPRRAPVCTKTHPRFQRVFFRKKINFFIIFARVVFERVFIFSLISLSE